MVAPYTLTVSRHPADLNGHHDDSPESPESSVDGIPSSSFPEVTLGLGLTAQLVVITPEVAAKWLAKIGKKQRTKKSTHLQSIVVDILGGRWKLNGETIIFDRAGRLIDGQHRLTAVVQTGTPVVTIVIRGVDPDAYPSIDIVAKRTGADSLRSDGVENSNAVAAACVLLNRYERGLIGKSQLVMSAIAIQEVQREHPGLAEGAGFALRARTVCRSVGVPVFCYYLFSSKDRDQATVFFDRLSTGAELSKGDPILVFREKIAREKHGPDVTCILLVKAWNAWRQGKSVRFLSRSPGETCPEAI